MGSWIGFALFEVLFCSGIYHGLTALRRSRARRTGHDPDSLLSHRDLVPLEATALAVTIVAVVVRFARGLPADLLYFYSWMLYMLVLSAGIYWLRPLVLPFVPAPWEVDAAPAWLRWLPQAMRYFFAVFCTAFALVILGVVVFAAG